tara:strand:+ start:81 stop:260 length:180 start_codon:yes stop_codon:yes gene_type:complete
MVQRLFDASLFFLMFVLAFVAFINLLEQYPTFTYSVIAIFTLAEAYDRSLPKYKQYLKR